MPGNSSTYLIIVYMYAWWFFNLLNSCIYVCLVILQLT